MGQYADMLGSAGLVVYIVIGLFVVLFGWWGYRQIRGGNGKLKNAADLPDADYVAVSKAGKGLQPSPAITPKVILGVGDIKCLCFHKVKGMMVADFTTIKEPIGEMYQFDPSCPVSGSGYMVKENEQGEIVDYDPREVVFKVEESPDYAHFAISWDIVRAVFFVPLQWWKSTSVWFAGAMLAIVFIVSLSMLG